MSKCDVFGVMITYNPDSSVVNNLNALIKQVSYVMIIDNGSDKKNLIQMSDFINENKVKILINESNMGIAYALNQGLNEAISRNFKLMLTMDQDSNLLDGCVDKMIRVLNENNSLISVGPNFNNKLVMSDKDYFEVDSLITSGNLFYTTSAKSIGGFTSDLFIDGVDFDFSLSLRASQGKLAIVKDAKMNHMLGEIIYIKIFNNTFQFNIHSPLRHYYMYRNHYYIMSKFIFSFTKYCLKKELGMWKYFLEVIFVHPNKKENIQMILKGLKHAVKNKYGKYST